MNRGSRFVDPELFRRRMDGFRRFADWESNRRFHSMSPAIAVAGIGFLYELLPPESRYRPVDVTGIRILRQRLAVLSPQTP